jgi:hypothetical protein
MPRTQVQHQQTLWGGIIRNTEGRCAENRKVNVGFEVPTSFHAGFLDSLFFYPEDGGDTFFRKVG